jgi:hypothetical protein
MLAKRVPHGLSLIMTTRTPSVVTYNHSIPWRKDTASVAGVGIRDRHGGCTSSHASLSAFFMESTELAYPRPFGFDR